MIIIIQEINYILWVLGFFLLQAFMDVQKLVKYHRETEVILVGNTGQHKTLLKYSPPQNAMWAFTARD